MQGFQTHTTIQPISIQLLQTQQKPCVTKAWHNAEKHYLFFLIWPWPWPNDLDTQTWPRYGQDVPAYQKWSFYVKWLKSYNLNRQKHRQTDTQTDRQTHRQTDMTENITYPHTWVVKRLDPLSRFLTVKELSTYWSCTDQVPSICVTNQRPLITCICHPTFLSKSDTLAMSSYPCWIKSPHVVTYYT